ncbi:MAG TPA: tripartite tricarboxylate transporter substrate-binding protein [Burkholderiaceae bacterium]|nr:tripartite tricarboxylate transporter substrate-binding protein [Burkholderiaceae bacterium]
MTPNDITGLPPRVGTGFYALYVPPKTPAAVIQSWNQAMRQVLALPEVQERMRSLGMEALHSTPEEVDRLTAAGAAKWGPIIRASGFSLD